jgi:hypothetical protein
VKHQIDKKRRSPVPESNGRTGDRPSLFKAIQLPNDV